MKTSGITTGHERAWSASQGSRVPGRPGSRQDGRRDATREMSEAIRTVLASTSSLPSRYKAKKG